MGKKITFNGTENDDQESKRRAGNPAHGQPVFAEPYPNVNAVPLCEASGVEAERNTFPAGQAFSPPCMRYSGGQKCPPYAY